MKDFPKSTKEAFNYIWGCWAQSLVKQVKSELRIIKQHLCFTPIPWVRWGICMKFSRRVKLQLLRFFQQRTNGTKSLQLPLLMVLCKNLNRDRIRWEIPLWRGVLGRSKKDLQCLQRHWNYSPDIRNTELIVLLRWLLWCFIQCLD